MQNKVLDKQILSPDVKQLVVEAPLTERKVQEGDFVGLLGRTTHSPRMGTVICVGGGLGVAPVYPVVQVLKEAGNKVISIIGARTRDMVIMEEGMRAISDIVVIATEDGSYGRKGSVTDVLWEVIGGGEKIDQIVAIGPVAMMRAVAKMTRPFGIRTIVSLNPILVDEDGMERGYRAPDGDKTKFACVDGPDLDGYEVDFSKLVARYDPDKSP